MLLGRVCHFRICVICSYYCLHALSSLRKSSNQVTNGRMLTGMLTDSGSWSKVRKVDKDPAVPFVDAGAKYNWQKPSSIIKESDRGTILAGITDFEEGNPNSVYFVHGDGEDVQKVWDSKLN